MRGVGQKTPGCCCSAPPDLYADTASASGRGGRPSGSAGVDGSTDCVKRHGWRARGTIRGSGHDGDSAWGVADGEGGMMQTMEGNGSGGVTTELQGLEAAYRIIQQRDGTAERRAWHWQVTAMLALVGLIGVGVWDHLDRRGRIEPFVQTVVQQDDGTLVSLGVPQTLLAYEPHEAVWIQMVGEWIKRYRWRGKDAVLAQADMAWVQYHTCGMEARRLLNDEQRGWKPEQVGKTLVQVELKSVTHTPSPLSYQVLWKETTIPKVLPPRKAVYRDLDHGADLPGVPGDAHAESLGDLCDCLEPQ